MQTVFAIDDTAAVPTGRFRLSLGGVGVMMLVLLLLNGILFQTYLIYVPDPALDAHRMFGSPFVLTEVACILLAMVNGFSFWTMWTGLAKATKVLLAIFVATFWVGGAFYSEAVVPANIANVSTLIHIAFAASLGHLIGNIDRASMNKFALWTILGMAVFALMIAKIFIFHPPLSIFPAESFAWQFAIPGFISVRLFGAFCGALLTYFVFLTIDREREKDVRYWHYMAVTLVAAMLVWSGTRAALVGFAAAVFCGAWLFRVRISAIVSLKFLIAFTVSAVVATLLIPYGDCTFSFVCTGDYVNSDAATGGRLGLWKFYARAYLDYPMFGAGPFSAAWLAPEGPIKHVQPHNAILQFLMSWGAIASMAGVALLAIATRRAHQITSAQPYLLPFLMMLYCLLVMSMFDGMLFFARDTMMVMLCYGLIFAADKHKIRL
jgi:exopolysaccharide production protein ExoQ